MILSDLHPYLIYFHYIFCYDALRLSLDLCHQGLLKMNLLFCLALYIDKNNKNEDASSMELLHNNYFQKFNQKFTFVCWCYSCFFVSNFCWCHIDSLQFYFIRDMDKWKQEIDDWFSCFLFVYIYLFPFAFWVYFFNVLMTCLCLASMKLISYSKYVSIFFFYLIYYKGIHLFVQDKFSWYSNDLSFNLKWQIIVLVLHSSAKQASQVSFLSVLHTGLPTFLLFYPYLGSRK